MSAADTCAQAASDGGSGLGASPSRRQSSRLRSPRAFPGGVEAWWRSRHPMNARGNDFGDIRDKDPPKPSGNKNLPGVNLQMMDGERPQKFRIGEIDRLGVLRKEFERFEQGPVLDVMAVLLSHISLRATAASPTQRSVQLGIG